MDAINRKLGKKLALAVTVYKITKKAINIISILSLIINQNLNLKSYLLSTHYLQNLSSSSFYYFLWLFAT